ncbi:hypothetical protein HXP44_11890 [Streptomyces sioyaensis]|uniref:Bacterial Ig domain-containing protein n=1 Tax=Streptomyces sioyaensis TaxID=67364 RepID=A0A4Q1QV79_9ACTN|nr:hypothetical protein [Streptomyces sioyaensis]MBM4792734.1 hypothetical protein [Streptomyces sioyaensis]RXS67102.1 hypothetical protein EST54_13140 [Streptomyces sioyaensis]
MIVTKRHSLRIAAVGALSAASVALAGTAAIAATPAASTTSVTQKAPVTKAGITAKPSVTSVKAWTLFRVTGTTTGIKAGSKVTLQQKQHGKWVSLPASAPVTHKGTYSLGVKLGLKGKNDLRIVNGKTASGVFNVTVR